MPRGQSEPGRRDEKSVDEKVGERARQKRATNTALILPTLCSTPTLRPPAAAIYIVYNILITVADAEPLSSISTAASSFLVFPEESLSPLRTFSIGPSSIGVVNRATPGCITIVG